MFNLRMGTIGLRKCSSSSLQIKNSSAILLCPAQPVMEYFDLATLSFRARNRALERNCQLN